MKENGTTHVLLIEDNPGDADLIRLRLVEGRPAVTVNCVDRLSDGLAAMATDPPSVVLLDLNLPDSHGADTFRKVLEQVPGVPVVILSGQDDEALAIKAVHQGAQDYLVKGDLSSKQLAHALHYAVERQALLRSLEMSRRQQLEFKNQFLSHVSHELRTPLTCIHQFVTLLLDGLAGPVSIEQREHLGTVLKSVNQLSAMIRDLLEATRAESGKLRVEPRCIAIGDLIQQAVAMLRSTATQKQIGLEIGLDTRLPLVHADPDRVLEILINLLDNGIKFTPTDGSVTVRACLVEADPDFVYVSVADTGRGISPEAKPLIFERLYQDPDSIDDNRKGLGLGLYISKELVRLHGGRIWAESQPGHGSVFSFTLPLFSLAKLLSPLVTHEGRLREAVTLITLELKPLPGPPRSNWRDVCRQCLELLRNGIFRDRDLVLPAMGSPGPVERLLVAASADQEGANVMLTRLRKQFENYSELKTSGVFRLSAAPVPHPPDNGAPLERQVEALAASVTEMAKQALGLQPSTDAPTE
jgi:signal transduction histidine kinase